jgi:organic hydroperoxide reductase OsmC/OhrA
MKTAHDYAVRVTWTGNRGPGTTSYRAYGRDHLLEASGKHPIEGSADPTFHGDRDRWNPEELLLGSLSQCHMMSYLHVATRNGVTVVDYADAAEGTMVQTPDGGGHFVSVTLRPTVTIAEPGKAELARSLHAEAARLCFIASSVNFPVAHEPVIDVVSV